MGLKIIVKYTLTEEFYQVIFAKTERETAAPSSARKDAAEPLHVGKPKSRAREQRG